MDLSFSEILAIVAVAVLVFGPQKIPEIARGLGNGIRTLRNASDEIKREIMKETDDLNPVSEVQKEIKGFKEDIENSVRDIESEEGAIKR